VASKGTARQAGTAFLAVNMVIDLILFSSSFVVRSFHNLEILACSGWICCWRKKTMSCVPWSSFLVAFFSSWIRANSGLISSASVSDGRASQDVSFVRPTGERSAALEGERPPEAGPNPVCLHKAAFSSKYYSQTPVSSFPYNLLPLSCILAPFLCQCASQVGNSCSNHVGNGIF
jgi:hypothetical protein